MMDPTQQDAPTESQPNIDAAPAVATRARSISRWAVALVIVVGACIAAIPLRVIQLKGFPDERLVRSMQGPDGKLAQQRKVSDLLPRGEILDRQGRVLALDAYSGTLYTDVRDLYIDTMRSNATVKRRMDAGKAQPTDRVMLEPILELATQLGPIVGLPRDEVYRRIVDGDIERTGKPCVPTHLRQLPSGRDMTKEELALLPRYVVIAKMLGDDQIRMLATAREEGGPASIMRAAHLEPRAERVRPYENTSASLVGSTGVDFIGSVPLAVDLRAIYSDALAYNQAAVSRIAAGEELMLFDDPVGELAQVLSPILDAPIADIAVAVIGPEGATPETRIRHWARWSQAAQGLSTDGERDEQLEEFPTTVVVKSDTTEKDRSRLAEAEKQEQPAAALRYVSLLPGREGVVGRSGVERIADPVLSAKSGYTICFTDFRGSVISIPPEGYREGDAGKAVRLSLDVVIQEMVEERVNHAVKESNASGGRCLVVDVRTGEILAAYSTLNMHTGRDQITHDWGAPDPALMRMRWATDAFEPGSIFKPFVWAWAIDHGFARRGETIPLPQGPLTLVDGKAHRTIREAHTSSYGTKSWEQVLVKSVNAGMATVAMRMGNDEMKRCLATWMFGKPTDVGIERESWGQMPPKAEWSARTRALASVSFGQGISVTPLQLVRAFSAFCRAGDMVSLSLRPHDASALSGSATVLSAAAVKETREVMEKVITEGTGKRLKDILLYRAFGKSGTAQLTKEKGGYYQDRYMSSFIAGAPYEDPDIVVLVTIEDPDKSKGVTGGGALAGPVVGHIINDVLGYMGVPTEGKLVYSDKKEEPKKKVAAR
jgi:cell division protein FtsI/penicillin-binding protein 2